MTLSAIALLKAAPALWFAMVFIAERAAPAREMPRDSKRLFRNGGLWITMAAASAFIGVPLSAFAGAHPLWDRPPESPTWATLAADFLILDLWAYAAHRAYHTAPFMWRFHAPHHLDERLDASTALRFHGAEVALSAFIRMPLIALLAMPLSHVLVYDGALLVAAIFHHSNLRIPTALERALSALIVTPSIHWVHHHAKRADTDSNYSGVFSFWDPLFGTRSIAQRTRVMKIGVEGLGDRSLVRLWIAPFGAPMRAK